MIQTLKKYDELSIIDGFKSLIKDRTKNLIVPLIIGTFFVFISWIIEPKFLFKFRLLWFVYLLLIIYAVYYLIRRLVKSNKRFFVVVTILAFIAFILRFSVLVATENQDLNDAFSMFYKVDELRGVMCVPIGMLIGLIPDITFKDETNKKDFLFIMFAFSITLVGLSVFTSTLGTTPRAITELVLDFIAFPIILYTSRYYKFNNNVINYLGTLSIYIYIYQQIPHTLGRLGIESQFLLFLMVLVPVLIQLYFLVKLEKKKQHYR